MFADLHARKFRWDNAEWATVFIRPIRFRIPRIDVAWATSHPQENHASRLGDARDSTSSTSQQARQCDSRDASHAGFQHISPRSNDQAFASQRIETAERMGVRMHDSFKGWRFQLPDTRRLCAALVFHPVYSIFFEPIILPKRPIPKAIAAIGRGASAKRHPRYGLCTQQLALINWLGNGLLPSSSALHDDPIVGRRRS